MLLAELVEEVEDGKHFGRLGFQEDFFQFLDQRVNEHLLGKFINSNY